MYQASKERYHTMKYHRCGKSGLKLPAVSLGLWHNFGDTASYLLYNVYKKGILDILNEYQP